MSYAETSGVNDTTSGACEQANWGISSLLTLDYNVTTERALYNNYVANVAKYPELGTTAYLWHEGYSTAAMQAVDSDSTAYPHRDQNHLL